MDFLKRFIKNVLPVNQIIKFIIKQFLSSYLIYNEQDIEEKVQPETGVKNIINIQDLELNVSNINNKHLLHSPIKLLKGKFGKFILDIDDDNKIIVTIEDVSLDLMPIFNFYKKYQETIFNMEETKKQTMLEADQESKNASGQGINPQNVNKNNLPNNNNSNNYMLNMANKLLTNLEINIKNISMRLFTYEISEKIIDNPVFTFFIMSISIYKNKNIIKTGPVLTDPNTHLPYEKTFLDNLVIDFDKLCLKLNNNINQKDIKDFAEIKNFCNKNGKNLTKEQENKILNFFIDYNTIFAINYKNGPCLSIKLNTVPRIEKYKIKEEEKQKIVEDMNIEINIAGVESILTPNQLFNIQIMSQISSFIFTLNKNTPNKSEEAEEKKVVYKTKEQKKKKEEKESDSTKDKDKSEDENNNDKDEAEKTKFSLMFKKFEDNNKNKENSNEAQEGLDKNNEDNIIKDNLDNNFKNINLSLVQKVEKVEIVKKEEPKKTEVLMKELSKFNITMNCKRIVLVSLENKDNESMPKLFSFLMEDEIISKQKTLNKNKKENINLESIIFGEENSSFENYFCYFEDNILLFKIDNINSVNTCINVKSILAEYIQPINEVDNKVNKKNENKSSVKNSKIEMSIYESAGDFENEDLGGSDVFMSVLENTQLLIMENYSRFINKYISGEYKNTKFEILTINDIKFDMSEKSIEINQIFVNINYLIILLLIKLMSKVQYFISLDGKPIYTIEDTFHDENNLNINLEKKINDTELQLFNNLKKKYQKDKNNIDDSDSEEGNDDDIFNESLGYSEEEKKKKDGMTIKLNYISLKINNISCDSKRFDSNIYFFNLFQELVYPNLSTLAGAKLSGPMKQYFQDIISKDFIEFVLIDINMIYYNISSISNINIVFKELLFNYWNETIIKYSNINNKNDLDGNPNISITLPVLDMVVNFSEDIKINLDKNNLDNLLSFVNNFLYGLSMYQIYDKYCRDLFNNKLINLFDLFGLKNHIKAYKNINTDEEKKDDIVLNKKISFDKKAIKEIERQMNKKRPNMSIGGRISCCVINLNKNKSFDEEEGNLAKIKLDNIGLSFEMFDTNENEEVNNNKDKNNNNIKEKGSKGSININKEKEEPIYNVVTLSISNIYFLIKEQPLSNKEEVKPSYYTLFSKNPSSKFESTDYFFMSFKFRNLKKINADITILEADEEEEEDIIESKDIILAKKSSKGSDSSKSKNSDKFKANNMKITLDPKTTDYIAFLLNNQIKLDNMEMVVDIKISETMINSFYDKLNILSSSLKDLYLDFTSNKSKENEGPFSNPGDRIPLCEDRVMFIKCDFTMNHFFIDVFLKEDTDKQNWMRLFLLIDNFKFVFNETGLFLNLNKNYVYILKDFSYIDQMKNIKENVLDEGDNINDILKEDSYMKRLGYTELFYNDKIELNKTEKEMNVDLGNINLFFCKDSYDFLLDFIQNFNTNYLSKIKDIFSKEEQKSEDSEEEIEKEEKKYEKEDNINKEENKIEEIKVEKNKNTKDEFKDFEVLDDVFFIDDSKKNKEKNNKKNYESLFLKKHPNKLETIEEFGKNKKKSKSSDNNIMDDFAIIETKSSLERKINRVQKEEDCITYLLKLGSLRLYLFQGSDFNFQDYPNKDFDLGDSSSNLEQNDNNNEDNEFAFPDNSNNEIHIDKNYLFKISEPIKKTISKQIRKRNEIRDYSNYILLNLIDMSFKIVDFSYFDFAIEKFFIDDNFENSRYKKIISKKDFLSENTKFLTCKIELIKNEPNKKENNEKNNQIKETTYIRINLNIPSLDIFVDQLPLNFIIKLLLSMNYDKSESDNIDINKKSSSSKNSLDKQIKMNDKKSNEDNYEQNLEQKENKDINLNNMNSYNSWKEAFADNEDNEKEEEDSSNLLIKEIIINSFTINFNYNSHKISFTKAYAKGDWIELLSGLSDIKELNLKFKTFKKFSLSPIPDTISELINFWKDDIISNQVANSALRGIAITRPFFKLYDGVKDLVKQPYLYYKENKGIKKGIKKGMKNFLVSFSSQGIFFGEKIFRGMKIVVFRKTKLSLKKKSLYKAWVYKVNKKQHDYEMYYYKQN